MSISATLDQLHLKARKNKWLWLFSIFNRVALAAGFLPSGFVKIMGERFTSLSSNHPMGNYLEALHHTGYYYTFIGVAQVTAAILLLIPRTATLGAILYFPIILNICILSHAVRFDGSLLTSPLMVLANLYLLCWDYHKLKFIFPFNHFRANTEVPKWQELDRKFPVFFFGGVAVTFLIVIAAVTKGYDIKPYNTTADCLQQFKSSSNAEAGCNFCDCIHKDGRPFNECLEKYHRASSTAIEKL
ncbi:DoxX family protein [Hymenobacter sp. BT730]|uniref:DoxX family protein n=1 Tax=Hymenobacter sp. BT730 TaxID=3063332 RepID=UPI0026DF956A|nr:DoxX family protein [Hymenobacter sp. BT730]